MHERGLLLRLSSESKNVVRRTVGDTRRYVIDITAPLLSEIGTVGTVGTIYHEAKQNQGGTPSLFPAWYPKKEGHPVEQK
jgi:hypothetical protein